MPELADGGDGSGPPRRPAGAAASRRPDAREATDAVTLGRRVRHLRRVRGMTLADLAARVGRAPSQLSLLENGRREPRLSLLQAVADALGVPVGELLRPEAPDRRAGLEIALERAQRDPGFTRLRLPAVRPGRRVPTDVLEHLVGLHDELRRRAAGKAATPEEARRANVELRRRMRAQGNYFPDVERAAAAALAAVGHSGGALSQRVITALAAHFGFTVHHAADLPTSTRSVSDLVHRRIYLPQYRGGHDPRYVVLQTLGHFALGHTDPLDYADFLRQRVEANYFAAALLVPQATAVPFLAAAKRDRALAMEDLRDVFAVSYETAAHRFTNLATEQLGLNVHFLRTDEAGTIYKAYENDGLPLPADSGGAIEGQPACRAWAARQVFGGGRFATRHQYTDTPAGTFWCACHVEDGVYAVTVGVPYAESRWFRGRETTLRGRSRCPEESCCRRPPAALARRWEGRAWPSARAHSHLLAALPPGTFPGVDETEVYAFLDRHAPQPADGEGGGAPAATGLPPAPVRR